MKFSDQFELTFAPIQATGHRAANPPAALGSLALTETWAGECGVRRASTLREKPRGPPVWGEGQPGKTRFYGPETRPTTSSPSVLTLPCPFRASSPLLSPLESPTGPLSVSHAPRPRIPYRSHSPRTWGPAPEGRRPGWQPPGPRGSTP